MLWETTEVLFLQSFFIFLDEIVCNLLEVVSSVEIGEDVHVHHSAAMAGSRW